MLSPALQDALSEHLTYEHSAGFSYLAMASYFEDANLPGFAGWMRAQYEDELAHATRFFDFIHQRGGRVKLGAIAEPRQEWSSPLEVFQQAYEQECEVTRRINSLVDLALAESDHATNAFLQWFVKEQVEEEAITDEVVSQLKLIGGDGPSLLLMDRQLSSRKPTTNAGRTPDTLQQA